MKKIILLLFAVLSTFISVAQEERHLGELESIIEINLSKSLLYNNAQQWASTNDPTCTKKIEIQDGDNASIVVKSVLINKSRNTSLTKFLAYKFIFTTKIDCKDGKYRRTISNPSVLIQDARDVNIKYASTKTLEDYMSELEAVARISENNFDKILEWGLDKVMDILFEKETIIKEYNDKLASLTGKTRAEKKERSTIEYKLEKIVKEKNVLQEAVDRWNIAIKNINTELDKIMKQNNDF